MRMSAYIAAAYITRYEAVCMRVPSGKCVRIDAMSSPTRTLGQSVARRASCISTRAEYIMGREAARWLSADRAYI